MGIIIAVVFHALIIHVRQAIYVVVKASNGKQYRGFLVSKDEDYYIVKTAEGDQLILSKQVDEILIENKVHQKNHF